MGIVIVVREQKVGLSDLSATEPWVAGVFGELVCFSIH
jgi:hypothetical protein